MGVTSHKPRVSVIMPCRNAEQYLSSSVASVLQSTFEDFELIIIDDASTDESCRIQRNFAKSDARIRLLESGQRMGPGTLRQQGLSVARGTFVAFVDADDIWAPEKLESQMLRLETEEADIVASEAYYLDKRDACLGTFRLPKTVSYESLLKRCEIVNSSVVIRKSLFDNVSYSNNWLSSDYATWLRLTRIHRLQIEILPKTLTGVRIHSKSHSASARWRKLAGHWSIIRAEGQSFIRTAVSLSAHIAYSANKQTAFLWRSLCLRR